jgi:hypothetical protein
MLIRFSFALVHAVATQEFRYAFCRSLPEIAREAFGFHTIACFRFTALVEAFCCNSFGGSEFSLYDADEFLLRIQIDPGYPLVPFPN